MKALTNRQKEILDYIRWTIGAYGYPPTVREIGARFKINSPNGVNRHLHALRAKGFVEWEPYKNRTLKVINPDPPIRGPVKVIEKPHVHYATLLRVDDEEELGLISAHIDRAQSLQYVADLINRDQGF